MKIAELNTMLETKGKSPRCHKCGRGFSDCNAGNATRIKATKYRDTTSDCENYCTACFYQYNCGFKDKDYD